MANKETFFASVENIEFEAIERLFTSRSANLNLAFYYAFKRGMDVVLVSLALLVLFPFFVIIGLLVKLDSPGPIIFKQKRVGSRRRVVDGRVIWEPCTFTFYKFRTMHHNCDSALHRAFIEAFIECDEARMANLNGNDSTARKLTADPRVTRIGKYLRRCSLDELPQFWNVFRGDMTLVGPRPALPYEVEKYKTWHHLRFRALPGLTGLWQVEARSSCEFDDMIRLDLMYVQRQSFWLDIKLLLKTPSAILRGKGAY